MGSLSSGYLPKSKETFWQTSAQVLLAIGFNSIISKQIKMDMIGLDQL